MTIDGLTMSVDEITRASTRAGVTLAAYLGRAPTEREIEMIVMAVVRYAMAPDAPSTRLQ